MNFGDLGLSEKLVMFSDGRNVVDYFSGILDELY